MLNLKMDEGILMHLLFQSTLTTLAFSINLKIDRIVSGILIISYLIYFNISLPSSDDENDQSLKNLKVDGVNIAVGLGTVALNMLFLHYSLYVFKCA